MISIPIKKFKPSAYCSGRRETGICQRNKAAFLFLATAACLPSSSAYSFEQKLGFRLQGFMESSSVNDIESQDMYFRRTRLEYGAKFEDKFSFKMDVRSDRVNQRDRGERDFKVGDAFVTYNLNPSTSFHFGRAKIDVSRTLTISSSDLLHPNRSSVSDFASEHISQSRRATNSQIIQEVTPWLTYQAYIGDGVSSESFNSALEQGDAPAVLSQHFTLGAKAKIYPFKGWRRKELSETYFGKGKHLSFGFGAGAAQKVRFSPHQETLNPSIQNFEISAHGTRFGFQAEYFSFGDVVRSFEDSIWDMGKGEGGYVQAEALFENAKLAPFIRYERWDRFIDPQDYVQKNVLAGVNYYQHGEEIRYGAAFEEKNFGKDLEEYFGKTDQIFQVYLMLHY
jgi:hypothetical protein